MGLKRVLMSKLIEMNRISTLLIFVLASTSASIAQVMLDISVKNIKALKGSIRVGLFINQNDFPKKASEGKVVPVSESTVTVTFENLRPRDYAISVIHDENNNGELDKNVIGIPKEGFAFGNNAMGKFGPPFFKKSMVRLGKDPVKQILNLRYF